MLAYSLEKKQNIPNVKSGLIYAMLSCSFNFTFSADF